MTPVDPKTPPTAWGTFEHAEALRRWAFLERTPEQRLEWLIEMLDIAYASGAIKAHRPADAPIAASPADRTVG